MSYQTKETGWTVTPARRAAVERAWAGHMAAATGRREDYYWLRDEQGLTLKQAAARMGVSTRTAERWDACRRQAVSA